MALSTQKKTLKFHTLEAMLFSKCRQLHCGCLQRMKLGVAKHLWRKQLSLSEALPLIQHLAQLDHWWVPQTTRACSLLDSLALKTYMAECTLTNQTECQGFKTALDGSRSGKKLPPRPQNRRSYLGVRDISEMHY